MLMRYHGYQILANYVDLFLDSSHNKQTDLVYPLKHQIFTITQYCDWSALPSKYNTTASEPYLDPDWGPPIQVVLFQLFGQHQNSSDSFHTNVN